MLRSIRYGVFETNSSSTHSITMVSEEEFNNWKNGQYLYNKWNDELVLKEDVVEKLKKDNPHIDFDNEECVTDLLNEYRYQTYESFFDDEYLESYIDSYTTKNGEKVVAFGLYGNEG